MSKIVPSTVFVTPSVDGIIHDPKEFTKPEDLETCLDILYHISQRSVWMSKNTDIVEIINNNFRDISSINISELSLAVASPSRKAIEHRYFQMDAFTIMRIKSFF